MTFCNGAHLILMLLALQSAEIPGDGEFSRILSEARAATEGGNSEKAISLFQDAIELYLFEDDVPRRGPLISRVRLDLVRALVASRQYDEALRVTEEISESDPGPQTLEESLQIRYNIGFSYLTGATRRLFGLEVNAESRGLEVLNNLIKDYPFMNFTADAIFHCGNWYLKNDQPEEAERYFTRIVREYPESDWIAAAQLLAGDSAMAQLKGVDYDLGILISAERYYRRYLRLFPGQGEAARARESLEKIDGVKARRRLQTADVYIRIEKFESARIYLEKVLIESSGTPEATEAQQVLQQIQSNLEMSNR